MTIKQRKRKKATRRSISKATSKPRSAQNKDKSANLFDQVISMTGIPAKSIKGELKDILDKKNLDMNALTLDQLRQVAASYLREIMGTLLERRNSTRRIDA